TTQGYSLQLQYMYQNGYLQSITDVSDSPQVAVWTANAIDAAGRLTRESLSDGAIVVDRNFDAVNGLLGSIEGGAGSAGTRTNTAVQNLGYLYDQVGNVIQRQDNNLGLTENFIYDASNRMTTAQLVNSSAAMRVQYSANGNVMSRSDVSGL